VEHVFKSEASKRDGNGAASVRYFSSDNYGDRTIKEIQGTGPSAKAIMKTDPRASRFLKTAKGLSEKHWAEILAAVTEFLNTKRKRKRSQSASSLASSDFIEDTIPEYTYISDSE
jgi:hypothetical protein